MHSVERPGAQQAGLHAVADPQDRPHTPAQVILGPSTRLMWRDARTVHLELGDQAVVVEGLSHSVVAAMTAAEPVPGDEPDDGSTTAMLADLVADGYLWVRHSGDHDPRRSDPGPRLAGELAGLAVRHADGGALLLRRRRRARVLLRGGPRLTAPLASLLAAAGVGRVPCTAAGPVRLRDMGPGGLLPEDEGTELAAAVPRAVARSAPHADTLPLRPDESAELVVLALDAPLDTDRRVALHAAGQPHLVIRLGTDRGTVGPLVLPGRSSCTRCADLHRRDRDPAWPALAAQLGVPRRYGSTTDAATVALLVAVAARQVLSFLDGDSVAAVDGTLDTDPIDWRVRRRSWTIHPACGCGQVGPAPGWAE